MSNVVDLISPSIAPSIWISPSLRKSPTIRRSLLIRVGGAGFAGDGGWDLDGAGFEVALPFLENISARLEELHWVHSLAF